MIISISGKINSGKDTLGRISQYLHFKRMTNHQGTYHTWHNADIAAYHSLPNGFKIKKFAEKLKLIASIITGVPVARFEDQEFKKTHMSPEWRMCILEYNLPTTNPTINIPRGVVYSQRSIFLTEEEMNTFIVNKNISIYRYSDRIPTYREFLQWLGTEAGRRVIHPNMWVNALMCDYIDRREFKESLAYVTNRYIADKYINPLEEKITYRIPKSGLYSRDLWDNVISSPVFETHLIKDAPVYPEWIVTDTRFPNELQALKDRGALSILVKRKEQEESIDQHESETALDGYPFDYTVENDAGIDYLVEQMSYILDKERIL